MQLPLNAPLSDFSNELLRLPTHLGGYGIPSSHDTSPLAYFSSILACLPHLMQLPLPMDGPTLTTLKRCHSVLLSSDTGVIPSERIPADFVTMLSTYSTLDSASKSFQIQHHISEQVDKFAYLNLLNRATPEQRAMLASASAPSAGAAFTVLPTKAEFTITSPYFNQLTRLRLGLPHHDYNHVPSSPSQSDLVQGQLSEDKQGRLLRHNLIANAVLRIAQDAGFETLRELSLQDDASRLKSRWSIVFSIRQQTTHYD